MDVSADDLNEYRTFVQRWQSGDSLHDVIGRIRELVDLYRPPPNELKLLGELFEAARFEVEAGTDLQTLATGGDKQRDELERFRSTALFVKRAIDGRSPRARLQIHDAAAELLRLEEGSLTMGELAIALPRAVRDRLEAALSELFVRALAPGQSWYQAREKIRRLVAENYADLLPEPTSATPSR